MILVTGATGQLGLELKAKLKDKAIYLDRTQLDLSVPEKICEALSKYKFTALINTAAYTQVDLAEKEKDLAFKINAESPGVMAKLAKELSIPFTHISTDYVFDGASKVAYKETDKKNPQSVYGASKSEGEDQVLAQNPNALIIRTSWVYSAHGKNFIKTITKLGQEKDELKVVSDQIGTLTKASDLAQVILQALEKNLKGIYHYSHEGQSSWYDVAVELKKLTSFKAKVTPIPTSEYPTPAKRPANSLLDKTKIKKDLNLEIPDWKVALEKFFKA